MVSTIFRIKVLFIQQTIFFLLEINRYFQQVFLFQVCNLYVSGITGICPIKRSSLWERFRSRLITARLLHLFKRTASIPQRNHPKPVSLYLRRIPVYLRYRNRICTRIYVRINVSMRSCVFSPPPSPSSLFSLSLVLISFNLSLLAPPSYEESMHGAKSIRERGESEHVYGLANRFAPRYPMYNFASAKQKGESGRNNVAFRLNVVRGIT